MSYVENDAVSEAMSEFGLALKLSADEFEARQVAEMEPICGLQAAMKIASDLRESLDRFAEAQAEIAAREILYGTGGTDEPIGILSNATTPA